MAEMLLVDLGNSRVKWATAGIGGLGPSRALAWREPVFPDQLGECWGGLDKPRAVVASAVAPFGICQQLRAWVEEHWSLPVHFLSVDEAQAGLLCGYHDPAQLGVDRWMAMVAAHRRYPQGCLVVDCGTATTLDAVAGRRHLGGYILPGIAAMREAVLQRTAVEVEAGFPEAAEWGTSTASCIGLGAARAVVALVEHALERLQVAGVCDPVLVLTGGDAGSLLPYMQVDYRRHPDLVLEGIMHIARKTDR